MSDKPPESTNPDATPPDEAARAAADIAAKAKAEAERGAEARELARKAAEADAKAKAEAEAQRAATRWTVSRSTLAELEACAAGLDSFSRRFEGIDGATWDPESETWTLARGWTPDVTDKLARECPLFLRWYARHGLIPLSSLEVSRAIRDAQDGGIPADLRGRVHPLLVGDGR
jgi:hypothetical protein